MVCVCVCELVVVVDSLVKDNTINKRFQRLHGLNNVVFLIGLAVVIQINELGVEICKRIGELLV